MIYECPDCKQRGHSESMWGDPKYVMQCEYCGRYCFGPDYEPPEREPDDGEAADIRYRDSMKDAGRGHLLR